MSRRFETLDWKPKKSFKLKQYEKKADEVMPIVMFDVAQMYLQELKVFAVINHKDKMC